LSEPLQKNEMMKSSKKILVICGSTRGNSANHRLIKAIVNLFAGRLDINIFEGIAKIPHFNPDLDNENPPAAVSDFRRQLTEADGILICTPEYAMGVPGTLKNAIDWTVSSMEFSHKPVALITASTSGQKAHQSLLETLKVIESNITEDTELIIPFIKTKLKDDTIIDQQVSEKVITLVESLIKLIQKRVIVVDE
jgi:NAD(P)H-dependent FMN reductase